MTQSTSSPPTAPRQDLSLPATVQHSREAAVDDSLASLHHMSRTAGLGSGDYVAINVVAVTAIIFGLASALVVVDPLFLALPFVGIVLAVAALYQILNSNGTQSGTTMAVLGLLFSLGFFTYKVGGEVTAGFRTRADRTQIESILNSLGQDLGRGDDVSMTDAYGKFDTIFTGRVPRAKFDGVFAAARQSQYVGIIQSIESNGQLKFDVDPRSGEQVAQGVAIVHLAKGDPRDAPRWVSVFRKESGQWKIEDFPEVFPAAQAPQPGVAPARASGSR